MSKTKNKSNDKKPFNIRRLIIVLGLALLALIISVHTFWLWELTKRSDQQSTDRFKTLIIESVKNLGERPVTDYKDGREYIPEAKIVLPSNSDIRLKYWYFDDVLYVQDENNLGYSLGDLYNAGDMDEIFEAVPGVQACSRQIEIYFNELEPEGLKQVGNKRLADKRTANIYQNEACEVDANQLIDYMKKLKSY